MPSPPPLQMGHYYHIFNRGNNGEDIFREKRNYLFFMQRYAQYIEPIAYTYAYCLLRNHFHFLVRTRTPEEQEAYQKTLKTLKVSETFRVLQPSRQFSKLFNSYAKAFNKMYDRTGSLFEHPFHRIEVDADTYFSRLVAYIHQNPQKHAFVSDFRDWPFSSYQAILSRRATRVQRDSITEWFGGLEGFVEFHATRVAPQCIEATLLDEDL